MRKFILAFMTIGAVFTVSAQAFAFSSRSLSYALSQDNVKKALQNVNIISIQEGISGRMIGDFGIDIKAQADSCNSDDCAQTYHIEGNTEMPAGKGVTITLQK